MRLSQLVTRDIIADFDAVRKAKRKPRKRWLALLRAHVLARYSQYWLSRHTLEALPLVNWSDNSADALRHCYSGSNETRNSIMEEIEEALIPFPYLCPYCLMRQPKSLDHFLPQDAYPEFSILCWNLVLVCEPCNRRKSNHLHRAPRSVLNPYFDQIPTTPLLHAQLHVNPNRVTLSYHIDTQDAAVTQDLLAIARRHLTALNLSKDLVREGTSFIGTIVNAIAAENAVPISQERLAAILDSRMRGLNGFPVNSWQVAVIDSMEQCPDLLAFVNARIAIVSRPARPRPLQKVQALKVAAGNLPQAQEQ